MSSGEEIDYSKFIGKFYPNIDKEEMERNIIENRKKRDAEDAIMGKKYLERKKTLKHKYSPIRRNLSKEEKEEFIEKNNK